MITLFRYTNKNMSGWEFLKMYQYELDGGLGGTFYTGNSASTTENMSQYDLSVQVKTKKELRDIAERLLAMGYTEGGRG